MLPHIPFEHRSYYDNLLRNSSSDAGSAAFIAESPCEEQELPASARRKRMWEDDAFLAQIDQYLRHAQPSSLP